ncbi:putative ABC transport system permease protein [Bacillus sp. 491mf]|uniref:FtsX-like permease family protein n=1 Tax=Bacillus TaxID=1386 RepID=UPI0005585E3B|nr:MULTISPECIES: ABC transporter permease [unclassified Bacillus (in: firmicutes)]SFD04019.1 putative ABC transport system permease protein [Bacillus sp. 491mf]
MLLKLSIHSIRKMMKDYLVLLIGLIVSISVFYMFQTMALNTEFTKGNSIISSIRIVFGIGSVLLSFITLFYILYANSFLLTLRRKELGMYMMLGAKKKKVAQLLFIETVGLGMVALLIGNVVGIGLASVVGKILIKGMDVSAKGYDAFYFPALIATLLFFFVLFAVTGMINSIRLLRKTELELIREDETQDEVEKSKLRITVFTVLGILMLGIGYYSIIHVNKLQEMGLIVATICTTIGTYFIFGSLLPLFVTMLKRNKKRNEAGLNSFTLAQLRFRINSLSRILGTVSMLIALGAGAMTAGMAFQKNVGMTTEFSRVYDATIHDPNVEEIKELKQMNIIEEKKYPYKENNEAVYFSRDDLLNQPPLISEHRSAKKSKEPIRVRVSEGLPEPIYTSLEKPETQQYPSMPGQWEDALVREFQISYNQFGGKPLRIADKENYEKVQGTVHSLLLIRVDNLQKYKPILTKIDQRQKEVAQKNIGEEVPMQTKMTTYQYMYTFMSGTMFMGFFLGASFLAMMASSLMFKILTGASRDKRRYAMLRKIGVRKGVLSRSIYKEVFFIFLFPGIVGIAHVLVGMNLFSFILLDPYVKIWMPISLFVFIYLAYYWITVQLYKGMVLPKV